MSYDLYCFRSSSGKLEAREAEEVISRHGVEISDSDRQAMEEIANDLLKFDPRLERFDPDFDLIAKNQSISVEEAKKSFDYIEINTPEEDAEDLQFSIGKDFACLSSGFGSTPEFNDRISEYVDVLCDKTGYFLYDPQGGSVTDQMQGRRLTQNEAQSWIENDEVDFGTESKPWWKFW